MFNEKIFSVYSHNNETDFLVNFHLNVYDFRRKFNISYQTDRCCIHTYKRKSACFVSNCYVVTINRYNMDIYNTIRNTMVYIVTYNTYIRVTITRD